MPDWNDDSCKYCSADRESESAGHSYPPYAYDEWVCDGCWDNCPECDGDQEWNHTNTNSTRKHSKKVCTNCGFTFITEPATE